MFKYIALGLLSVGFIYKLVINLLSYRSRNNPIPSNVSDVYDYDEYLRWKKYHSECLLLDTIFDVINFLIFFFFILFDIYAFIGNEFSNQYLSSLMVVLFFFGVDAIISFIHQYIANMKIEEKYGFNKTTLKTFISDQIKSLIISLILFGGLLMLFIVIFSNLGDWTLLLFTGIAILLILLISFLAPKFAKIFNKFTPLEEGNLRTKLLDLLNSHGYSVKEIKVMDASKRSTKSNAYFSGLGKTKTIVLYDTLLNNMSEEEIIAIFAHELGHGLHKDIIKNTLLSFLNIALIVIIAWLNARYPQIYGDFGFNNVNYAFALILLLAVELPIISPFMGIISSAFSRKAEYKADEQAVKEGYGKELITSLKKLTKENFGNLSPNKIVVLLEYSHPTVSQRIEQIEKKMVNND